MTDYLLLIRGGDEEDPSQEQLQSALERYRVWAATLQAEGRLLDAAKLTDEERRLSKSATGIQVDGPFSEAKETIGGFYIIRADSYDEAVSNRARLPCIRYGWSYRNSGNCELSHHSRKPINNKRQQAILKSVSILGIVIRSIDDNISKKEI